MVKIVLIEVKNSSEKWTSGKMGFQSLNPQGFKNG